MQSVHPDLGQYQFRRLLGEGGFGQVFEAWDPRLQRAVAIKRLRPNVQPVHAENLVDEARRAASLRHPAFVSVFALDGEAGRQSIVMEFIEGRTVAQLAAGQRLPPHQVLDIAAQVALAMQQAHVSRLTHGDLKPSNLMVEPGGAVRILDFGLARRIDPDATETLTSGDTTGTIAYQAPERLTGKPSSARSDVYALGVVTYELLTGARPFAHLNGLPLAAALLQSSSDQWPFPADMGVPLVALVRAMTARDPARRLQTMQAVREALAALDGAQAGAAAMAAPGRRLRKPLLVWSAVTFTLVLGGAALALPEQTVQRYSPFFSETQALQDGLAALEASDHDERLDQAIGHFNALMERRPGNAAAAAGLAQAYVMRYAGHSDEAWLRRADASAQMALALNDQLASAHASQGAVRLWQGRLDEAMALFTQALRLDPLHLPALTHQSTVLLRKGRAHEAEQLLAAAILVQPRAWALHDALGSALLQQGKHLAAEQAYRRALQIRPDAVAVYANLNGALLRQGRGDEALQAIQQGLQIRPSGALYTNLGTALFNRNDYVGAARAFDHALSPERGGGRSYLRWANLGDALRWLPGRGADAQRAYEEAVALLQPMVERASGDAVLLSRLGLYRARLGDPARAVELTEAAIKSAPASAEVRFRATLVFEISGKRERALAELDQARTRGYPAAQIGAESDLIALRRDPRYR